MFQVDHICGAMILIPDEVRMNAKRADIIRKFVASTQGINCNAIIGTANAGEIASIDLYAGDCVQREAFKQSLTHELFS